jgi:hypothetical protein
MIVETLMVKGREVIVWREGKDFYFQVAETPGGGDTSYGVPKGPYGSKREAIETAKENA